MRWSGKSKYISLPTLSILMLLGSLSLRSTPPPSKHPHSNIYKLNNLRPASYIAATNAQHPSPSPPLTNAPKSPSPLRRTLLCTLNPRVNPHSNRRRSARSRYPLCPTNPALPRPARSRYVRPPLRTHSPCREIRIKYPALRARRSAGCTAPSCESPCPQRSHVIKHQQEILHADY